MSKNCCDADACALRPAAPSRVRAWSVDCGSVSLNERVCVLRANHEQDHRAADGRTWSLNQNWQDEIDKYLAAR